MKGDLHHVELLVVESLVQGEPVQRLDILETQVDTRRAFDHPMDPRAEHERVVGTGRDTERERLHASVALQDGVDPAEHVNDRVADHGDGVVNLPGAAVAVFDEVADPPNLEERNVV